MENRILIGIIAACCLLLVIGILRHRLEVLVNIVLRMVMGILGIYLLNIFLKSQDIVLNVGINEMTVLTVGLLGLPGFMLIYGLELYYTSFR